MATNFPASLDSLTNPTSSDSLASPSHAAQHANVNDAVEALQAKVGVDGSAVTSSLDYKVANQGLTFIKSQTIGSGVSSVTVTGAFSSTFDNYRVHVHNPDASWASNLLVQVGSKTSGYYGSSLRTQHTTTTIDVVNKSNAGNWYAGELSTLANSWHEMEFLMPYHPTNLCGFKATSYGNGYSLIGFTGVVDVGAATTQFSSFTLFPASGTLTGGTIIVYGYNNG